MTLEDQNVYRVYLGRTAVHDSPGHTYSRTSVRARRYNSGRWHMGLSHMGSKLYMYTSTIDV